MYCYNSIDLRAYKFNIVKLNNNNIFEFIYTEIKNVEKTDKMGCVITRNTKTISC